MTEGFKKSFLLATSHSESGSSVAEGFYRPAHLEVAPSIFKIAWISFFMRKTGAANPDCDAVWSFVISIYLCKNHTNVMENALTEAKNAERSCSTCGGLANARRKQRVAHFNCRKLRGNPSVQVLVEDAIAVYTDNYIYRSSRCSSVMRWV